MKRQTFLIAAVAVLAMLLSMPSLSMAKPSVSSGNYAPQQSPPQQQTNPYRQNNGDQGYAGSEMPTPSSGPGVSPPTLPPPAAVPEPISLVLFGLGLAGAGVAQRFRKKTD